MAGFSGISDQQMQDFREGASMAVATRMVESVAEDRANPKEIPRKYPPPVVRSVLLIQACLRRKAFMRSFGNLAYDEDLAELAPPEPLIEVALYMCRRMRNPHFVDVENEASIVSGVLVAKEKGITMDVIHNVVKFYEGVIPDDHYALVTLNEKLQKLVIDAHETLQDTLSRCATPAEVRAAVDEARRTFQVLPELESQVFSCADKSMKAVTEKADIEMKAMIKRSVTTLEFKECERELERIYGPVETHLREELEVAMLRRVQFLEMELETRWSRPFAGPLPPHSRAARRYELELGLVPSVQAFLKEERSHAAKLEAQFDVQILALQGRVRSLTAKRKEARVRYVIQDLDQKLVDASSALQRAIEEALVNLGTDNQLVNSRARELLSLEAHTAVFAMFAERTAEELRGEIESNDFSPEAADRRRGVASALLGALTQLNSAHPYQVSMREEFKEEFAAVAEGLPEPAGEPPAAADTEAAAPKAAAPGRPASGEAQAAAARPAAAAASAEDQAAAQRAAAAKAAKEAEEKAAAEKAAAAKAEAELQALRAEKALRAELQPMKYGALRRRAEEVGATEDELDAADDEQNAKSALIKLIVDKTASRKQSPMDSASPPALPAARHVSKVSEELAANAAPPALPAARHVSAPESEELEAKAAPPAGRGASTEPLSPKETEARSALTDALFSGNLAGLMAKSTAASDVPAASNVPRGAAEPPAASGAYTGPTEPAAKLPTKAWMPSSEPPTQTPLAPAGPLKSPGHSTVGEPDEEDDWGSPAGFEFVEVRVSDQQKGDSKQDRAFKMPGVDIPLSTAGEAGAEGEHSMDPAALMMLQTFDADALMKEQTAQQPSGITVKLTLQDLTMDVVKLHTEAVFKAKFSRALADASGIPKERVTIQSFQPGSVIVMFHIKEPLPGETPPPVEGNRTRGAPTSPKTAEQVYQDLQKQVGDPGSKLRLGEVGPFVSNATMERGVGTVSNPVAQGSLSQAYVAPAIGTGTAPLKPSEQKDRNLAWTGSTAAGETMKRGPGMGTTQMTWGAATGAPLSGTSPTSPGPQFRTTCPKDPAKSDNPWTVPYQQQEAYTFYDRSPEDVHPGPPIHEAPLQTRPAKQKFQQHATFCLTRHPVKGTDAYKDLPVPQDPTIAAAASWLENAEAELQDPGLDIGGKKSDWPDFKDLGKKHRLKKAQESKERRVDVDGRAVTFQEMCAGLSEEGLSPAQLQERWDTLKPAEDPDTEGEGSPSAGEAPDSDAKSQTSTTDGGKKKKPKVKKQATVTPQSQRDTDSAPEPEPETSGADTARESPTPSSAAAKKRQTIAGKRALDRSDPTSDEDSPVSARDAKKETRKTMRGTAGADTEDNSGTGVADPISDVDSSDAGSPGPKSKAKDKQRKRGKDNKPLRVVVEEGNKQDADDPRSPSLEESRQRSARGDQARSRDLGGNSARGGRQTDASPDREPSSAKRKGMDSLRPPAVNTKAGNQGDRSGLSPKSPAAARTPKTPASGRPHSEEKQASPFDSMDSGTLQNSCYVGMLGGIPNTGVRHQSDQNTRLPSLVGKPTTDDMRSPAFMYNWYRHEVTGVGPPYRTTEEEHEESPQWTAMQMLDATLDKNDWKRSYSWATRRVGRGRQEWSIRGGSLGPSQSIRGLGRSQSQGAPRHLPPVARRPRRGLAERKPARDHERPPMQQAWNMVQRPQQPQQEEKKPSRPVSRDTLPSRGDASPQQSPPSTAGKEDLGGTAVSDAIDMSELPTNEADGSADEASAQQAAEQEQAAPKKKRERVKLREKAEEMSEEEKAAMQAKADKEKKDKKKKDKREEQTAKAKDKIKKDKKQAEEDKKRQEEEDKLRAEREAAEKAKLSPEEQKRLEAAEYARKMAEEAKENKKKKKGDTRGRGEAPTEPLDMSKLEEVSAAAKKDIMEQEVQPIEEKEEAASPSSRTTTPAERGDSRASSKSPSPASAPSSAGAKQKSTKEKGKKKGKKKGKDSDAPSPSNTTASSSRADETAREEATKAAAAEAEAKARADAEAAEAEETSARAEAELHWLRQQMEAEEAVEAAAAEEQAAKEAEVQAEVEERKAAVTYCERVTMRGAESLTEIEAKTAATAFVESTVDKVEEAMNGRAHPGDLLPEDDDTITLPPYSRAPTMNLGGTGLADPIDMEEEPAEPAAPGSMAQLSRAGTQSQLSRSGTEPQLTRGLTREFPLAGTESQLTRELTRELPLAGTDSRLPEAHIAEEDQPAAADDVDVTVQLNLFFGDERIETAEAATVAGTRSPSVFSRIDCGTSSGPSRPISAPVPHRPTSGTAAGEGPTSGTAVADAIDDLEEVDHRQPRGDFRHSIVGSLYEGFAPSAPSAPSAVAEAPQIAETADMAGTAEEKEDETKAVGEEQAAASSAEPTQQAIRGDFRQSIATQDWEHLYAGFGRSTLADTAEEQHLEPEEEQAEAPAAEPAQPSRPPSEPTGHLVSREVRGSIATGDWEHFDTNLDRSALADTAQEEDLEEDKVEPAQPSAPAREPTGELIRGDPRASIATGDWEAFDGLDVPSNLQDTAQEPESDKEEEPAKPAQSRGDFQAQPGPSVDAAPAEARPAEELTPDEGRQPVSRGPSVEAAPVQGRAHIGELVTEQVSVEEVPAMIEEVPETPQYRFPMSPSVGSWLNRVVGQSPIDAESVQSAGATPRSRLGSARPSQIITEEPAAEEEEAPRTPFIHSPSVGQWLHSKPHTVQKDEELPETAEELASFEPTLFPLSPSVGSWLQMAPPGALAALRSTVGAGGAGGTAVADAIDLEEVAFVHSPSVASWLQAAPPQARATLDALSGQHTPVSKTPTEVDEPPQRRGDFRHSLRPSDNLYAAFARADVAAAEQDSNSVKVEKPTQARTSLEEEHEEEENLAASSAEVVKQEEAAQSTPLARQVVHQEAREAVSSAEVVEPEEAKQAASSAEVVEPEEAKQAAFSAEVAEQEESKQAVRSAEVVEQEEPREVFERARTPFSKSPSVWSWLMTAPPEAHEELVHDIEQEPEQVHRPRTPFAFSPSVGAWLMNAPPRVFDELSEIASQHTEKEEAVAAAAFPMSPSVGSWLQSLPARAHLAAHLEAAREKALLEAFERPEFVHSPSVAAWLRSAPARGHLAAALEAIQAAEAEQAAAVGGTAVADAIEYEDSQIAHSYISNLFRRTEENAEHRREEKSRRSSAAMAPPYTRSLMARLVARQQPEPEEEMASEEKASAPVRPVSADSSKDKPSSARTRMSAHDLALDLYRRAEENAQAKSRKTSTLVAGPYTRLLLRRVAARQQEEDEEAKASAPVEEVDHAQMAGDFRSGTRASFSSIHSLFAPTRPSAKEEPKPTAEEPAADRPTEEEPTSAEPKDDDKGPASNLVRSRELPPETHQDLHGDFRSGTRASFSAIHGLFPGRPAVAEPTTEKPLAEPARPTVTEPAAEKPAVTEPAVGKPADKQPEESHQDFHGDFRSGTRASFSAIHGLFAKPPVETEPAEDDRSRTPARTPRRTPTPRSAMGTEDQDEGSPDLGPRVDRPSSRDDRPAARPDSPPPMATIRPASPSFTGDPASRRMRTNAGATREQVLSFAQSLTSSIFRTSNNLAMQRAASQPQMRRFGASPPRGTSFGGTQQSTAAPSMGTGFGAQMRGYNTGQRGMAPASPTAPSMGTGYGTTQRFGTEQRTMLPQRSSSSTGYNTQQRPLSPASPAAPGLRLPVGSSLGGSATPPRAPAAPSRTNVPRDPRKPSSPIPAEENAFFF